MSEQLEMQDCYLKAEPGEPKFTLLARDPLAQHLIFMWASLSKGDVEGAVNDFAELVDRANRYKVNPRDEAKVNSADDIARNIAEWRIGRGLR